MKKNVWCVLAALVAAGSLAACSGGNTAKTTAAADTTAPAATTAAQTKGEETKTAETEAAGDVKAAWPTGDVKIIVPNPSGGASDMCARLFADYVSRESGKNVVIINETGGSNTVGFETVRNAKPDGSTLLSFHGTTLLNYYSGKIDYSILDESAYTFGNFIYQPSETSVNCVAVSAKSPYQTIEDLLNAAKEKPGTISCGDGFGSSAAVLCGQIELAAGVQFKHVDAPDTTTRITNIIGGQIDFAPLGYAQATPYVESGDIRLLAMDGSNGFDESIPTFESLGYQNIGFSSYGFVAGPAGMDAGVVAAIDAWCQDFCGNETCRADIEKLGFTTEVWTRDDALSMLQSIDASTKEVTEALGW